jgi:hypothetical protein
VTAGVPNRKRAVITGLLAVALALGWQFLVVRYTFAGNWTAWFCTGGNVAQPDALAFEHLYRFAQSDGYDGQFYHYIAHDPLFQRGFDRYIDAPRLRYRRILIPALAFVVSAGQDRWIDTALIALNLLFIFAGAYWLSRYAQSCGHHPAWGALFLLVPAVLVSLDRLTVDLALTALCVAFALYVSEKRAGELYVVLLLAPLARETGLLLSAAYCAVLLFERRSKAALVFATSAIPAIAWFVFVQRHTVPYDSAGWFTPVPFSGVIDRMIHPVAYPFLPIVKWAADILDECSLAGIAMAFALSLRWPSRFPKPLALAALLITLSGITLGKPFWENVFGFGRVFSPLIVLIALQSFSKRLWWKLLPLALIDPRIGLQLGYKLSQVVLALGR